MVASVTGLGLLDVWTTHAAVQAYGYAAEANPFAVAMWQSMGFWPATLVKLAVPMAMLAVAFVAGRSTKLRRIPAIISAECILVLGAAVANNIMVLSWT